jgi:leucyl-tRNA synthetase
MEKYDHTRIEKKWQKEWENASLFKTDRSKGKKEKFYLLDMFPYPSASGLHMGHTEQAAATDALYRFYRMQGKQVLHPQGFDSFGLPAENFAIKTGTPPQQSTDTAIASFKKQMNDLGLAYDFTGNVTTSEPHYYKWTQWIFGTFFEHDLVYKKTSLVNWCPSCNTVIANEQVVNGECERCGSVIEQKETPGYFFKITDFADELIEDLDTVDWPKHTIKNQRNWIGKSEGATIQFPVVGEKEMQIEAFTTRPDTLFGATYMVLAPEHPLITSLRKKIQNIAEVDAYIKTARNKTELERMEDREKTGVCLEGIQAVNPARKKAGMDGAEIPIYISDYVLASYGTGAIMAVPAHDERDYAFAKKFNIAIQQVVVPCKDDSFNPPQEGFEEVKRDTVIVHLRDTSTGKYALLDWHGTLEGISTAVMGGVEKGQTPEEAALTEIKEETAIPNAKIVKKLSWITAAKYCASHKKQNRCAHSYVFMAEVENLKQQGEIPEKEMRMHTLVWEDKNKVLSHLTPFHQKQVWELLNEETALTEPGYLINSGLFDEMSSEKAKQAITDYVGGTPTATYRLRDWSISRQRYWGCPIPIVYSPEGKAQFVGEENLPWRLPEDVDFVPTGKAPLAQSKELKDRVEKLFGKGWTPEYDTMDTFVDSSWYFLRYPDPENDTAFASKDMLKHWMPVDLYIGGAEHTYMHLLFARFFVKAMKRMGLLDFDEPFKKLRHQGMVNDAEGKKMSKSKGNVVNPDDMVKRFGADATRAYMLFAGPLEDDIAWDENHIVGLYRFLEKVWKLQDICSDTENSQGRKRVHKAVAKVTADLETLHFNTAIAELMKCVNDIQAIGTIHTADYEILLKLLSPFAPHVSEELFAGVRTDAKFIIEHEWPAFDPSLIVDDVITLAVQVNGKKRGEIDVAPDATQDTVEQLARDDEKVSKWLKGDVKKVVYVPSKILNFVL